MNLHRFGNANAGPKVQYLTISHCFLFERVNSIAMIIIKTIKIWNLKMKTSYI